MYTRKETCKNSIYITKSLFLLTLFFQLLKIHFFFFVHPVEFNLPREKSLGDGNAHIHEVKFKFKDEINKIKAFSLFSS